MPTTQTFLKLLASDKSPKDVAREMNLPEKAVYDALNRVRRQLGLNSTYGLVAWAVVNGLAVAKPAAEVNAAAANESEGGTTK